MKRISGVFAVVFVLNACAAIWAAAPFAAAATPTTITIQPTPPPAEAPDVLITTIIGSTQLDYLEVYNQSDNAINLAGWQAVVTVRDTLAGCAAIDIPVPFPSGWLLPKKYLTFQRDTGATSPLTIPFTVDATLLAGCIAPSLTSISVVHAGDDPLQTVTMPSSWTTTTVAQHKQRSNSPNSTRTVTGSFPDDYKIVIGDIKLDSDPLYTPPANAAGLQVVEILPNAHNCPPLDTDPTCSDYVKLYNPTEQPINLAAYRLRIGYQGQSISVTNTFTWGRQLDPAQDELLLPPQSYILLSMRNDGVPLSITDTGNYIWLEDAFGAVAYEPVIRYPDASSTATVGSAWAWDGITWRWTSEPQPNAPNYFPPETITPAAVDISSTLKPCASNQYRNPETNRCNTIIASAALLTPCDPGEERNPATNRCRSIVTAGTDLTPCQPGWERNPDTNRCRKIAAPAVQGAATAAITDAAAPSVTMTGWFVAVIAVLAALSYAMYEWRQDILLTVRRLRTVPAGIIHKFRK